MDDRQKKLGQLKKWNAEKSGGTGKYHVQNSYGIESDGQSYRSPMRAIKDAGSREGEGWHAVETESGRKIQQHPENKKGFVYND
jgi:hypothetical protein